MNETALESVSRTGRIRAFVRETEIVRVLEAFNGDLYFVAEQDGDEVFCYARLYAMPEFAEWGYNSLSNLRAGYRGLIWDVPNRDWPNLRTYNVDGLRVEG